MKRIQIQVDYIGNTQRWYPVPPEQGWKIDTDTREIKIGVGFPRTVVPLDRVLSYEVQEYEDAD